MIEQGEPNGYVYAAAPAMCYSRITNGLWIKTTLGWDPYGWHPLIAPAEPTE